MAGGNALGQKAEVCHINADAFQSAYKFVSCHQGMMDSEEAKQPGRKGFVEQPVDVADGFDRQRMAVDLVVVDAP